MEKNNLSTSRIDVADVLRGLSVMAILLLHSIEHFNFYSYPPVESDWLKFTDKIIWDSLFFAFGGKAYAIFALLFGFSFFIQDNNQLKKGKDFRGRFMWRLVLLFVIGNFNAMFFTGEILVLYSLVGFSLVLVARLPNKAVLIIAILLLLQPVEWGKVVYALMNPDYVPGPKLSSYYWKLAYPVLENGTFLETVKMNLWEGQLASLTWAWEYGRVFQTAGLFMLGMLVGRTGLFVYSEKNIRSWVIILIVSLLCFFSLTGLSDVLSEFVQNETAKKSLKLIVKSLANFSFMLILVSCVVWVFYMTRLQNVLMKVSPYGKMSLTNYITQSMMGSLLFYNWGLGLYADLGKTHSFLVGIVLVIIQYSFCKWWMKNHTHGPMEAIWRKATWIKWKKS